MKLNKKGMTLFELLAVIVILGIVAAIGFPTVNGLIQNTRKDAFASNVNNFVAAAVTDAKSEAIARLDGETLYILYYINTEDDKVYRLVVETNAPSLNTNDGGEAYDLSNEGDFTNGNVLVTIGEDGQVDLVQVDNFKNANFEQNNLATGSTSVSIDRGEVTATSAN